jgi:hypothetical protein
MQSFVIDSCSLMFSFQLRMNGIPLSDFLGAHFKMLVHREIVNELTLALPRAYSRWRERGLVSEDLSEIRRKHAIWLADRCTDVGLDAPLRSLDKEKIEGIVRLDSGEKVCLALAKLTSYEDTVFTVFLTDDYKAGECAQTFFDMYQCGLILRTADVILFFGLRYRCAKTEIHQALRDLLSFYTNTFESLLTEVGLLLPEKDQAFIEALLKRGEFNAARTRIAAINLAPASRSKLLVLMDQVSELAGEGSIVGYTLNRLRNLTAVAL